MQTAALLLLVALLAACEPPRSDRSSAPSASAPSVSAPSASAPASVAPMPSIPPPDAGSYPAATEQQAIARRLAGSLLVGGHAMDTLRTLADDYGGRLTGSDAHARAAAWAAETFRRAGVAKVALEPFTIQAGWTRGAVSVRVAAPIDRPLHAESLGWSPPTPAGGVQGEVVFVKDATPGGLPAGTVLRDKIALLDRASLMRDGKFYAAEAAAGLKAAGAVAILVMGRRDNQVLGASALSSLHELASPLSVAAIGKEDGELLKRLLEKGLVSVTYSNASAVLGPIQVPNVVAEIPGRETPDEWVLVGAHLDSWDFATGAQDNGSGVAEVIEAARAIEALGAPPRRSIRFALWGGEEQWLLGSLAYAESHQAELDRAVFVLNTDNGAGMPKGWSVDGREDLAPALKPLLAPLLTGLGDALAGDIACDTDHCSFALRGVPALNLSVDMSKYDEVHHTPSDTLDKVSPLALASGAAIVAVTAYAIADAPERLAKRLDHAAVEARLKKAGLLDELTRNGAWKR